MLRKQIRLINTIIVDAESENTFLICRKINEIRFISLITPWLLATEFLAFHQALKQSTNTLFHNLRGPWSSRWSLTDSLDTYQPQIWWRVHVNMTIRSFQPKKIIYNLEGGTNSKGSIHDQGQLSNSVQHRYPVSDFLMPWIPPVKQFSIDLNGCKLLFFSRMRSLLRFDWCFLTSHIIFLKHIPVLLIMLQLLSGSLLPFYMT